MFKYVFTKINMHYVCIYIYMFLKYTYTFKMKIGLLRELLSFPKYQEY